MSGLSEMSPKSRYRIWKVFWPNEPQRHSNSQIPQQSTKKGLKRRWGGITSRAQLLLGVMILRWYFGIRFPIFLVYSPFGNATSSWRHEYALVAFLLHTCCLETPSVDLPLNLNQRENFLPRFNADHIVLPMAKFKQNESDYCGHSIYRKQPVFHAWQTTVRSLLHLITHIRPSAPGVFTPSLSIPEWQGSRIEPDLEALISIWFTRGIWFKHDYQTHLSPGTGDPQV